MGSDDDIIIRGGPLKYWLTYKVWGIPGWAIVAAVAVLSYLAG